MAESLEFIVDECDAGQRLDLFLPVQPVDKPLPIIVWVHGGGWDMGDRHDRTAVPLTAYGYAVASIDYRLSQQATFPAQIEDCKGAVRWLRANAKKYDLDPDHVGVWGASAGGHLVALLGTTGGEHRPRIQREYWPPSRPQPLRSQSPAARSAAPSA